MDILIGMSHFCLPHSLTFLEYDVIAGATATIFHPKGKSKRIADILALNSWTTQAIPETVYLQT